jgi:signal peptidase I
MQIAVVSGTSMEPTLQNGNVLITERLSQRFGSIKRNDIVTIYVPEFLEPGRELIVKRVIGVAGDTVEVKADGKVYINYQPISEKYINGSRTEQVNDEYSKVTVPKGYIYVLGDNRLPGMSKDSRTFGPVELSKVRGVAIFRLFPLNRLGTIK